MKATYLIPIWVDIKCDNPMGAIKEFNALLEDAMGDVARHISKARDAEIEISWSVNQNIKIRED